MNAVFEKATRHITRSHYFLGVGLVAVGLVALVAILAADLAGTGDAPTVSRPVGKVDTPASAAQGPAVTYYIVANEEQGARVSLAMEDAARIRYGLGEPWLTEEVRVIVADDPAGLRRQLKDIDLENGLRSDAGLPPVKVVDIR